MVDDNDPTRTGYQDKQTGLCFDPQIGEYTREGMRDFELRDQGYQVRYRGPGSEMDMIDIYIFGQEQPDVPEGVEAEAILAAFAQALEGLSQRARDGHYLDYEVLVTERATFSAASTSSTEFLHAAVTYRHGPGDTDPDVGTMRAHLFLRGFRRRFVKMRLTYRLEIEARVGVRFQRFCEAFIGQFQPLQ